MYFCRYTVVSMCVCDFPIIFSVDFQINNLLTNIFVVITHIGLFSCLDSFAVVAIKYYPNPNTYTHTYNLSYSTFLGLTLY